MSILVRGVTIVPVGRITTLRLWNLKAVYCFKWNLIGHTSSSKEENGCGYELAVPSSGGFRGEEY